MGTRHRESSSGVNDHGNVEHWGSLRITQPWEVLIKEQTQIEEKFSELGKKASEEWRVEEMALGEA